MVANGNCFACALKGTTTTVAASAATIAAPASKLSSTPLESPSPAADSGRPKKFSVIEAVVSGVIAVAGVSIVTRLISALTGPVKPPKPGPDPTSVFTSTAQPPRPVVVRREFRTLSKQEQLRFCRAVDKMCEIKPGWTPWKDGEVDPRLGPPPNDKMPCEFFRIASYHGWPFWGDPELSSGYCAHGIETFPVWHRPYMVEFERALQAADISLGGDGNIALPYWGWNDVDDAGNPEINGQIMPKMIREHFRPFKRAMLPEALVKAVPGPDIEDRDEHGPRTIKALKDIGFSIIPYDGYVKDSMMSHNVIKNTKSALGQLLHSRFATIQNVPYSNRSLEEPHNAMHNACGFPMRIVGLSAFHPVFFLHHANIDRLYETYLQNCKRIRLKPQDHFASCNKNLYNKPLAPFQDTAHSKDGKPGPFMPAYVFEDTETWGYTYDKYPEVEPISPDPSKQPIMVRVDHIDPKKYRGRSFSFHAFIVKKGEAFISPKKGENLLAREDYAGADAFFGSKNGPCETCNKREDVSMRIDITENLQKRRLTRDQIEAKVWVEELGTGAMSTLENIGLTEPKNQPIILGPLIDVHALQGGAEGEGSARALPAAGGLSISNISQIWKYLALMGYLGEEKRQRVIDDGFEKVAQVAAVEAETLIEGGRGGLGGPSAAQSRALDPQSTEGLNRLKSQLGLPQTRQLGAVDSNLALKVAQALRYNTLLDRVIDKPTFLPGSTVYYTVTSACYLDAASVADELREAVNVWAKHINLNFVEVEDATQADLVVSFDSLKSIKPNSWKKLGFGEKSQVYSIYISHVEIPDSKESPRGHPIKIILEIDWTFWMLQSTPQTANPYSIKDYFGTFFLFQVLLHNIGSALGLADSDQPDDVMCPLYNESHKALTENDIRRVSQLYPKRG